MLKTPGDSAGRPTLKRAFFTLYFLVVLAILVLGWGLDYLYQRVGDQPRASAEDRALITLLAGQLERVPESERQAQLQQLNTQLPLQIKLYRLDDFAESALKTKILAGDLVVLMTKHQRQLYYYPASAAFIVRVLAPRVAPANRELTDALLLIFYLALALVIYLWVWPLVRDLRLLERHAREFGRQGKATEVKLGPRSAVYQVACEFNRMRQRIDELLASYREMTYAVSHELRTPLSRMKFALALVDEAPPSPALTNPLKGLRVDVQEMEALITQLLSYAGFEAQSQTLTQQQGDLSALTRQLIARQQKLPGAPRYQLKDQLQGRPVDCEWSLIERVLHNLLSNAEKFARTEVRVSLCWQHNNCCIQVEDDGPGIAAGDCKRVFDSFVRLPSAAEKHATGFGLGLAIVKRIMQWHRGGATASQSKALGGASIRVCWPQNH